jgi:hypothetical protein
MHWFELKSYPSDRRSVSVAITMGFQVHPYIQSTAGFKNISGCEGPAFPSLKLYFWIN